MHLPAALSAERWWARPLAAVAAGAAMGLSWQPYGLWPLMLVGMPAFTLLLMGLGWRRSFGLGYLFGLTMLTLTVGWVHVLGWWVAGALIVFESLAFGLLGLALSLVTRLRIWPLAAACCWVMVEFTYSRVPFGGFGWVRLAYAAVDTPVAGYLPVIGVAGVGFAVALIAHSIAWILRSGVKPAGWSRRRRALGCAVLVAVIAVGGLAVGGYEPEPAAGSEGMVKVGVVQGNVPGRGIQALGRARSVTNNHLAETIELMARVRLGQVPPPDFLLWPENSTDIDPHVDPITHSVVSSAVQIAGRPILVGAVTEGPGPDERQTTAMWWDPHLGVTAVYHKRNLVPFGEWIPFRAQLLPIIPLLREVGAQSVAGSEPGVLTVQAAGRTLRVGDVICFELAYDRTLYSVVRGGAQILMVQSNNATYGGTGQIEQQFAITRARAMEARREIAVATTDSVSGYIDRDGRVVTKTAEFTAASFVAAMPLRSALTPAMTAAPWIDRLVAAAGLAFCVAGAIAGRAGRRRDSGTLEEPVILEPVSAGR